MLSVNQALELVLNCAQLLAPRPTPLESAVGCVLAETVISDIESPPHDKSIVDGYALIAADAATSGAELHVLEQIVAGAVPTRSIERGTAAQIMTGAPLPSGADAVVMIEQTEPAGDRVRILHSPVKPGQNIVRRATSLARGQTVLESGRRLRAIEIGLLAEVGRTTVAAMPRPRVAVLATGNELVESGQTPGPGQIRNSNGPLLNGLAAQAGAAAISLGIARDDAADLRKHIEIGLTSDVLLLSGGVSAGVLDLVPQVLADCGVRQVFHKVNLKPGKPLWFGVKEQTLVFGLPGNPVSSLVCFELFARPAIEKRSGRQPVGLARAKATLTKEHKQRGDRPAYWPGNFSHDAIEAEPLSWHGSGDLWTLTGANCFIHFPSGDRVFAEGDEVEVLLLDES